MRYFIFIIISFLFLASCATPQNEPQSFYGKVYAPGKVSIEGSGVFVSTARVKSAEFSNHARKAAYFRLMENAVVAGYKGVRIHSEEVSNILGYKITIHGRLYLISDDSDNVYPISNISRVLKGLPLKKLVVKIAIKPKSIKKTKPKKRIVVQQLEKVILPKPTAKPVSEPILESYVEPEIETIVEPLPEGAPTVIMAPVDITGSIVKAANDNTTNGSNSKIKPTVTFPSSAITIPKALSGTPLGVVGQKK